MKDTMLYRQGWVIRSNNRDHGDHDDQNMDYRRRGRRYETMVRVKEVKAFE